MKKNRVESKQPFQRLYFLQRDWSDKRTYAWGVVGGQQYIESKLAETGSNNGDINAVRKEIKNAFKNVGCCLLPGPGDLVNGQDDPPYEGYELCFKDVRDVFKVHLHNFFHELFDPNNLTPKEVSGMKLQGENVLNYVHQYHKLLESGAISSPLTAIEADALATAQTMTNALVKEYHQRMAQVPQSYLSEKQLQENHKTFKSQLGQKFDSEMKEVWKTYPNIVEKYKNLLDVEIEKDLVLCQQIRLTEELKFRNGYEKIVSKAVQKFREDLQKGIDSERCRKKAIQFIREMIKTDAYYAEYESILLKRLQVCEEDLRTAMKEKEAFLAGGSASNAENPNKINKLAFTHLDKYKKSLLQLGEKGFMKKTIKNRHKPMITAQIEKFQTEAFEKFPGNDEIPNVSEALEIACNEAYVIFLMKYDDVFKEQETEFNLRREEVKTKYLRFMNEETSNVYINPTNLRDIHEMFLRKLKESYQSNDWKKTEIYDHFKEFELQCIEDEYKRLAADMEEKKGVYRESRVGSKILAGIAIAFISIPLLVMGAAVAVMLAPIGLVGVFVSADVDIPLRLPFSRFLAKWSLYSS
ncbi:unnamed protein product [Clavelina lepadiformis]|uniref:Guanylate-binding protein N-terminal domain-containing protein n=1 Tax=Clavelina lepadiformis TaxID=159417 RepID=A0ABP0GUD6_CLALP